MYTVYDKPWRTGGGAADKIYRPSKNMDKDVYGDDVEKLIKTNKCVVCYGQFTIRYWHLYCVLLHCLECIVCVLLVCVCVCVCVYVHVCVRALFISDLGIFTVITGCA